jgi:DnaJ-class molecular chaperone
MKTLFYHESFDYQDEYDIDSRGTTGIEVDATRVVCPTCDGTGSHFRRDLDENLMLDGIREDGDEDSMEAYMGGAFDQICTECNGDNVVLQVDWDTVPKWVFECVEDWDRQEMHDRAVRDAERMMGA